MVDQLSQRAQFLQFLAQTNDFPLMLQIASANGCFQEDISGKKYLDLISGIAVANIGHNHPSVIDAIKKQADKHLHVMVYGEFIQSPQVAYAQFLTQRLPEQLNCVYFTNSGTEATEGALKLAKRATRRTQLVSCKNAYHGSTQGALSIAGSEELKNNYRPLLPDTLLITHNNIDDLAQITEQTAAVVVELVQAEAGMRPANLAYIKALRKRCTEVGALLIFDEIQTAFGRLGHFYGSDAWGIYPDIMLLGKALGGGMPLGAFVASQELMSVFKTNPILGHITTFGGHPLSCAAGLAAAQVLIDEDLMAQVAHKEMLFKTELKEYKIYGKGLMLALELDNFEQLQKVCKICLQNGLITDWFLFNQQSIRICPPLTISPELIKQACKIIKDAIKSSK